MRTVAIAFVVALGLGVAGCGPGRPPATPLGLVVPALDGGEVDLASYRGRVVVVHAFTTWSLGAQADVTELAAVHDAHPDEVTVIGLALDDGGFEMIAAWRKAAAVRYLVAVADDAVRAGTSGLGPLAVVPTTIVLDRTGRPVARIERGLHPGELPDLVGRALATK